MQDQIIEMINTGIVVLDRDFVVHGYNRWMAQHSGVAAHQILTRPIFEFFPSLDSARFRRNCKAVFQFGNFSFFAQRPGGHLFPFPAANHLRSEVSHMQQNCTIAPLYDEERRISRIFISVEDVTASVLSQNRLSELNSRDASTGLYNRRYLTQQLAREFGRAKRYRRPLTVMMLDIDHFKRINDGYGHQFGDEVILAVSTMLVQTLRSIDFVARYGGEEFCCFLPETGLDPAEIVAERIRARVAELRLEHAGGEVPVTISVGLSEIADSDASAEALLRRADEALYLAKNEGRNRVRVHT